MTERSGDLGDRTKSVGTPVFFELEPVKEHQTLSCRMKFDLDWIKDEEFTNGHEFLESKLSFTSIEEKPPQEEEHCERDSTLGTTE